MIFNAISKLCVAKILFQLLLPVNSIGFQAKFVCKNESSDTHILFDFLQIFFWKYFSGMQTFKQVCAQSIEKISVWGGNNMPKTPDQKLAYSIYHPYPPPCLNHAQSAVVYHTVECDLNWVFINNPHPPTDVLLFVAHVNGHERHGQNLSTKYGVIS